MLFHDSGYKSVQGLFHLDKTWRKRMEDSYCPGSNNHPLCGLYKGAHRHTDRFDEENPVGMLKYFRYAQKAIGNQASWADLAAYMSWKTDLKNCTVGGKRATFNSSNLCQWFRRDREEKSPVKKLALTEEMKRERVKWCKKIKRLIRRIGGNFYACFLDEKWFDNTCRWRKTRLLCVQPGESEDDVQDQQVHCVLQ